MLFRLSCPAVAFLLVALLSPLSAPLQTSAQTSAQTPPQTPAAKEAAKKPPADPAELTIDRIFKGSEFASRGYSAEWLDDSSGYLRTEGSKGPVGGQDIVVYRPADGGREVLIPARHLVPEGAARPLTVESYALSRDHSKVLIYTNSKKVWRRNTRGDYWVLDRTSLELKQLGGDREASSLMFAKLSPDGRRAAYVWRNDIYVEDLRTGTVAPLTSSGSETTINGTFDWVYEEELGLRDGFRWSADSRSIAFWQLDSSGVRLFPMIHNTAGLYPRLQQFAYPKTGERNSAARLGVRDLEGGDIRWLDIEGDPRNHYLARMEWIPGKRELLVQQLNRVQNENRVLVCDADTGLTRTVFVERDDAWVDVHDELFWLAGDRFTWMSERDGWRQCFVVGMAGAASPAASDSCDVIQLLGVAGQGDAAYLLASPQNATQSYLYQSLLDGGALRRLTPEDQPGTHSYAISPDGKWAIHSWSSFDQPPRAELISLPDHKTVRVLEENKPLRAKLEKLGARRPQTEFFQVELEGGVKLDGWCIRPAELAPGTKHPLLVHVYGEPAGQTVLDRWGGSSAMWHRMLAQQGFVVMSFDNRGTPAPKGRAWRKCVHRQVGIQAPREQAAAVRKVLQQREYLDADRVGVWGWSGGGSMTLNALFKFPDLYHVGISIAPVPNQRHYDTIYQERYMDLPADNVTGYFEGSSIHFAHQLQGDLLLAHGTADDNVHYQGAEALVNELIKHNKQFTMMPYPGRSHSISEGVNTSRHLRQLMTNFLHERLMRRPVTAQP